MRVVWRKAALRDLAQIRAYLRAHNPAAAERVATRIVALGEGLATFPHRGRPVGGAARELMAAWPYIVVYRVSGDAVRILRVWHGARDRPRRPGPDDG